VLGEPLLLLRSLPTFPFPLDTDSSQPVQDQRSSNPSSDLRGATQLVVDAIVGVTDLVESMHRTISSLAPLVGPPRSDNMRGISGLVYRSVRTLSRAVGGQLDTALARLAPLLQDRGALSERREAVVAALNGVLGDHLAASNNSLALPMRLRRNGRPLTLDRQTLARNLPNPSDKLLVLVHGLCMNDLQWRRDGHNHGAFLADALGYTPLYLHCNSGRHISTNGRQFAERLEQVVQAWPVPVRELAVIGHSMGGLVARSAGHYARREGHDWPHHLQKLVFLGTPHHGTPLERAGSWVDALADISPYTAPFARIGKLRSNGVQDLRHGTLIDADWEDGGPKSASEQTPVPLPNGVRCFAIAARRQRQPGGAASLWGDGLVPVQSALGQHEDPKFSLSIPPSRRRIFKGLNHFDLLSSRTVGDQLHRWLG